MGFDSEFCAVPGPEDCGQDWASALLFWVMQLVYSESSTTLKRAHESELIRMLKPAARWQPLGDARQATAAMTQ